MSYLALYRRFRPQVFQDLIGQETVVRALVNQIKTDQIGHAYLFCGARGTGKTTASKIFARAINCEEKNGTPCGKCSACQKLNDPNNMDIIEMDAASNNSVDHIREIRDKVQYPPVAGRYKVYIIDEVHMLTASAFNALLKTLEEPPAHAIFILATTEPHKLPATILSRCMRFDFKLIPTDKIAELIENIFKEVGKEFDKEAVMAIARAGEGSVRDALSIADICVSYKPEKLTYSDVIEVLGTSDRQKTARLAKCVFENDSAGALDIIDELCSLGKNVGMLVKDVLSFFRDIMVVKSCRDSQKILALPEEDIAELKSLSECVDNHGLLRCLEIFSAIENDVKYSTHPRIIFETAVVKATTLGADYNIDSLLSRIAKLEESVQKGISVKVEQVSAKSEQPTNENVAQKTSEVRQPTVEIKSEKVKDEQPTATISEQKPTNSAINSPKPMSRSERLSAQLNIFSPSEDNAVKPKLNAEESQKQESPQISETQPKLSEIQPQNQIPDKRIWGTLIRKLRETGNTMLWVICQELESVVENGKITIYAQQEREYMSVTKKENLEKLKQVLATITPYPLEVVFKGEAVDTTESDIEKLKADFDKIEIID